MPGQELNSRFFATRSLVRWLLLPYWVPQVVGEEWIPSSGPALLVANHPTILDAIFLTAVLHRPVSFVISSEVAGLPLVGPWFCAMGSAVAGRDAFATCLEQLRSNRLVGLMPEGGPTHSQRLGPFRTGVAALACQCGVPVVPVAMVGQKALMEERCGYLGGGPIGVRVGRPLTWREGESLQGFINRLRLALEEQMKLASALPPWRPDWRFRCAQALWVPLTAALFWWLERVKPGHRR